MKIFAYALAAATALPLMACATPANPTPVSDEVSIVPTEHTVHSYILLDRTGSMSNIWDEALGSVNAYADSVGKVEDGEADDLDTAVTLAVFDYQESLQFDVLRKDVEPDAWAPVTSDEASPRGMTPLFDAIGRMVALAEKDAPEKAVIVIMTDGMENSSREITKDGANAALDRARARGWEVVFLGAEFANFDDAEAVGVTSDRTMAVGAGQLSQSMETLARKSRDYGKGEEAEIIFDEADRAEAGEEDVKQRNGR